MTTRNPTGLRHWAPMLVLLLSPGPTLAESALPAFPGAEGFGSQSAGGRGGKIYFVTHLGDTGPGSFREACEAQGPRIVVFKTGGTIALRKMLQIKNPYITIAGQSAPGGGICLRNDPVNEHATVLITTHDVVLRHLRIRSGPSRKPSSVIDAVSIEHGGRNVVIDHCSLSWSVDETFQVWEDGHDITVQWCFITESLHKSVHAGGGAHGKGIILGTEGCERISIHHTLLAHHMDRNPRIGNSGIVDFVNNVIYNPGELCHLSDKHARQLLNYVGNYVKLGPTNRDALKKPVEVFVQPRAGHGFSIYVKGNIGPNRPRDEGPEELVVQRKDRGFVTTTRHEAAPVTTLSAEQAYERVLAEAGATLPRRDSVDVRIVKEVQTGTGRVIDDPSDVGGWPELEPGTPPPDADNDGMPDTWETAHGLDPNDPSDGNGDVDRDGYTNIEEVLNGTDPRKPERATGSAPVS